MRYCELGIRAGSDICYGCVQRKKCDMLKREKGKDMDKEKFIVTTTKFAELKKELNKDFHSKSQIAGCNNETLALKSALDKVLDMLDEFIML